MNGMSCWGIELSDRSTIHVHSDRVWVDQGCLIFSEERANPDASGPSESETTLYATAIFAAGHWIRAYAASVVDGTPLPVVCYPAQGGSHDEGSHRIQPEDEEARRNAQP